MNSLINDRAAFNFNLSAFLSAARSALQYAHKEAKDKTGGQAWYDAQVAAFPLVRFLKDKRNISIHTEPVEPQATISASFTETIQLSESLSVSIQRADGTVEEERILGSSPPSPVQPTETESTVTYQYFFTDWTGTEDVLDLCQTYITDVQSIVTDGVANGFVTS